MIAYTFIVSAAIAAIATAEDISIVRRNLGDLDTTDSCNAVSLVPREFWKARPAEQNATGAAKVLYVEMTNTYKCQGKEDCASRMLSLQRDDMKRGLPDVKYNFVIGFGGNVYVGRDFKNTVSDLDRDDDERSNGIIIGVFGRPDRTQPPPPRAMAAIMNLVICGMDNESIEKDVRIRHVEDVTEPCKGSLGEKLQRMIASAYGPESAYNPSFECITE